MTTGGSSSDPSSSSLSSGCAGAAYPEMTLLAVELLRRQNSATRSELSASSLVLRAMALASMRRSSNESVVRWWAYEGRRREAAALDGAVEASLTIDWPRDELKEEGSVEAESTLIRLPVGTAVATSPKE